MLKGNALNSAKKRVLRLPVIEEYFVAVQCRKKKHEYRLVTPYWEKRLVGRDYDEIEMTWGYPKRGDESRRIRRPWKGFSIQTIRHPHFGSDPVRVFAIRVNDEL